MMVDVYSKFGPFIKCKSFQIIFVLVIMSESPRELPSHYVTLEREVLIRNDGIRL